VPEEYVKARLIEAVPCPGSLMEAWFSCQAANNNKGACFGKPGCTWIDWSNYTSLPLPTRRLQEDFGAEAGEPGACQVGARAAPGGPASFRESPGCPLVPAAEGAPRSFTPAASPCRRLPLESNALPPASARS
jgi:hypothetical protein